MATEISTHETEDGIRNRDIKIWVNDTLTHGAQAMVSVHDSGFMLGDGVWGGCA